MKTLKKKNNLYVIAGLVAGCSCMIMVAFPAVSLQSAEKGVSLWANSVLPALLPFFICANFMSKIGVPRMIGKIFEKSFQKLFGAPGESAFVFLISITSGYPMGAKLIGDLGRSGQITENEAKRMLTFCSTSGPLFILGTVGVSLLNSAAAGSVIACAHYAGAILNGILYRCISSNTPETLGYTFQGKGKPAVQVPDGLSLHHQNILELFTDSIVSSLKALGIICGYIVLFTMITDFIFTAKGCLFVNSPINSAFLKGIFEMTVGCNAMSQIENMSLLFKSAGCAFIISFGGFSILAQSMSMMSGLKISIWYYMKVKLTHGLLSFVIVLVLGPSIFALFAQSTATAAVTGSGMENLWENLGVFYGLLFSTKMIIMITIIFVAMMVIAKATKESKGEK